MKKVSVVLPVYNGETYLKSAINSVINQKYTNWELIIVDDCSTDNTCQIIEMFAKQDGRIKLLKNDTNLKLPKSLNRGFSIATGEYWTWTSDDNLYNSDAIEKMVEYLEREQDCIAVYGGFDYIDPVGRIIGSFEVMKSDLMPITNVMGACFLYRADSAKEIGTYDPEMFLVEDYDYWMRMYLKGKIGSINQKLYKYRLHEKSLSSTQKEKIRVQELKLREKYFDKLNLLEIDRSIKYRYYDYILLNSASTKYYVKRILKYNPIFIFHYLKFCLGKTYRRLLKVKNA